MAKKFQAEIKTLSAKGRDAQNELEENQKTSWEKALLEHEKKHSVRM